MDKILLDGMTFYGYHGVFKEENKLGQRFIVDAELFLNLCEAGKSDNLELSVSYADVFELIKSIVEGEPFKLIEALAEKISSSILTDYSDIKKVKIRIRKPEAPVPGVYNYFGVEIERERNGESLS